MRASTRSTALAALACTTMKLMEDVLAIAHEPCRLAERLALLCLLTEMELIDSDT